MPDYYWFIYSKYRYTAIHFKVETVKVFIINVAFLNNIINRFCKF